ncbi:hypothetical protein AMTRI_Chr12g268760 [Amborella trichopoda]
MAEKQLVVIVEGTAAMGPFWPSIQSEILEKIIRVFYGSDLSGQKLPGANVEFALIMFYSHGPYSDCLLQRSGWTRNLDLFLRWLSSISFSGGGFGEAAIGEGLSEALWICSNMTQSLEGHKHCILVAASNPHALPTPVPQLPKSLDQNGSSDGQKEIYLADAETVAKAFSQYSVSLSVISPKNLPKLRAIYNAAKRNSRVPDPAIDNTKYPHYLILLSDLFVEARAALRPGITNLPASQNQMKFDSSSVPSTVSGPPPATMPSANVSMMNRQPMPGSAVPIATVKVEATTVTPMSSMSGSSHLSSSILHGTSPNVPSIQTSSPPTTSQEMIGNVDAQEFKPVLTSGTTQSLRPVSSATANVSILNNLSQARQVMGNASLTGASNIGLQAMGGAPMPMHMSNMISTGMASTGVPPAQTVFSSAQSSITSVVGSQSLVGTTQVGQNTAVGNPNLTGNSNYTSAASNLTGNPNLSGNPSHSVSPPVGNLQGVVGMGQSIPPGMGQGNLSSGTQMGQQTGGLGINHNMLNSLGQAGMPSGMGTMIPTPGMTQQVQAGGLQPIGMNSGSANNMQIPQLASASQQPGQMRYIKILAADWPPAMQIMRLISQDHMNNKQYVGKADFLVFRALNRHGFLDQLQEKKLCAVIQLQSQTLLLSVSDKASRLIGMLFPGDMVVFKPNMPSQQQQQQQQPQQGQVRPQMLTQGQLSSQGPSTMTGGGFLP